MKNKKIFYKELQNINLKAVLIKNTFSIQNSKHNNIFFNNFYKNLFFKFGLLLIFLFITNSEKIFSQSYLSMGLYQNYPEIHNIFAVYDKDGNWVSNLKKEDFVVKENGVTRTIKSVSCGYNDEKIKLSSVLTIDVSGSMANGGDTTRMDIVKKAADAFINGLDYSNDECAVTSFDHRSFINQDFTTNNQYLLDAISNLKPLGGTNYDEGFYGKNGGLTIIERGKTGNKRILIFVTDGESKVDTTKVKQLAASTNTAIFTITISMNMPTSLKRLAESTGGLYFDNMKTISDVVGAFNYILQHVKSNGSAGCSIVWESDVVCNSKVEVSIEIPSMNLVYKASYNRSSDLIPNLTAIPTALKFGDVVPGNTKDLTTTIKANGQDITIDSSSISNKFTVTNWGGTSPPFTLTKGSSRIITVRFTPTDSNNVIGSLNLFNDGCKTLTFSLSGGKSGAIVLEGERTLKVISPNGGEVYSTCDSLLIEWEGIAETDTVEIRYSTNNGQSWNLITEKHWGSNKYWWKHKGTVISDKILISVEQLGIMVYETNLIDAQNPTSVFKTIPHPTDTTKVLFGFWSYQNNYLYNFATKTFSKAGTIGAGSCYNKNGTENYWIWDRAINSHNTSDGSFKFGNVLPISMSSVTPDYYNNRVIVGDYFSGKLYILNETNFNLIDSLEFHDSAPFEYNFSKDKKRMISSAQNEAIIWDMTTYDTLKIFRNTGGFAYYFNVKDEDKIHYIKDNKMNTYSLSTGNVTSYNIKISNKNYGYATTMATMADGENIIFVELIGGIDENDFHRDFEGYQVYKTNINTQTSTLLFGNKGSLGVTYYYVTKSHTSNEAYINSTSGRPRFYRYNNVSNTYDSLNVFADIYVHPGIFNLGYDASSIYSYGGWDTYLQKIDRKTNKLIKEYGPIRALPNIAVYDSGKKINWGGWYYFNVIDSSMNFIERRTESGFAANHNQNLGKIKNNLVFVYGTNKMQSRIDINTVEHTYYLDFNYAGNHAITSLKDGTIVVVSSENTEKFTDIYFFKEGVSNPILSKRLDRYTRIEKVFAGGDFIAIRIENEDFGKVFEIYDLELNILKQFKDVNTTNNYFGISSNGKYIYKYVDDKNVRVERIDNGKIMKNYNFTGNSAIHSTSLNLSDDLNYAGFYINDDTQVEGKKQRLGIFYLGIPYLQADTSDAVFEIAKPVIIKTSPLNIGTIAIGKNHDASFSSVLCNNSKFDLELDKLVMKSGLKIKLISNVEKTTLKPGECIDLEFNYTPTIVENVSDTLFTYIGCDTIKVAILASSATPSIQVLNNIIDFKDVAVDKTKDTINAITIKNTSATPITINNVKIEGPDKTQFTILSGGGSFSIPAGQEHKMNFKFAPVRVGRTNTRLEFAYSGIGSPAELILLGNGYGSPRAVFKDSTVFDTLKCGRLSQDTIIKIKNNGSANLVLNNFTFTPNKHYFISNITFPKTIAIGDSTSFNINFEPFESGNHKTTLKINSNDTLNHNKGELNFYFSGVKDSVNINFDKNILDFGITQFPKTEEITVTNNGSVDLNVSDIQFDHPQFKIINPLPPFVVGVGKSETLTIEFTPIDTLSVVSRITMIGEPCTVLQSNLLGGGGTPILQIQDEFNFIPDNCKIRNTNSKVYLWNMGNLDLNIDSIYIDGVDKDEFEIAYPLNKITISPRKNDSIIVNFKNRVFEERNATINIKSNSVTGELAQKELKARKYNLSIKSSVDILDFGVSKVAKIDSFYVYNDGELDYILSKQILNQPQFKVIEPNLPYELKVGDSVWVKIEFTPEDTLSLVSDLTLSTDDCPSVMVSILGGSGTPRIRTLEILDIKQNTCEPKDSVITIEYWNMGNLPLEVYDIKLIGANADQFRVNLDFTGTEIIQARNKSKFDLIFKAGDNGRYLAQVLIVSNSTEGDKYINLIAERSGLNIEAFGFTDINDYIIDFGVVSTPSVKSFYINNKGTESIFFEKVELSNPKFEIIDPVLPFNLSSNVITEVKVRYNAINEEAEVGVLKLLGNPCGEIIVDLVSGYNTPTLKNTPEKIDFSLNGCNSGDMRDSIIYLWNLGNEPLEISKISIIGQNANQFRILYPTQGLNLTSKAKDSIVVRYQPTVNGNSSAKILIENNSQNPNIEINLTGTRLKGELKFKPAFLDFGLTQTPITLKTEVENVGDFDILINNYNIDKTQFTVANLATPLILKPKEIKTLFIEFSPTDTNSIVAKLTLNTNGCGDLNMTLLGGGGTPVIQTIDRLEFNTINCSGNSVIDSTFEIWNMGTLPLVISKISVVDDGSGNATKFEVLNPLNDLTILPRLNSTFTIRYNNSGVGIFTANILIESNSVDGDVTIPITANSFNSAISVDRESIDFGLVQTSKKDKLTITNNGNVKITIDKINIKGVDSNSDGAFYVENITPPFDILPNESQELVIVFNPNDTLSKMANLNLEVTPCGNADVVLLGGGGTPNIQSIKDLDFVINSCKDERNIKSFTLWNMGALDLEISDIILENNSSEFKILSPSTPTIVTARSKTEFMIEFYTIQTNTINDRIIIKSNATEGDYHIYLTGQKFSNTITIDNNNVSFGSLGTPPFNTRERVIKLTNNTELEQTIYEPIFKDSRFRLVSPSFPLKIKSLETLNITIMAIANFVDTTKDVSSLVEIRTENCGLIIANLSYRRANGSAEFLIGKGEEIPNKEINIPIILTDGSNLNSPLLQHFETEVEFNATMLYPLSLTEGEIISYEINNGIGLLKLKFPPKTEINKEVTNIKFKTLLGNSVLTELKAQNYQSIGEDIAVNFLDGEFSSMGICYADGARLINPYGIINLGVARPNPVQNLAFVDVELIEKDLTKLTLYNNTGFKIQTLFEGIAEKGMRTFSIDAKDLSSGVYYLVLETPTYSQTSKFEIVK